MSKEVSKEESKLQRIKNHVRKNKKEYIVITASVVASVITAVIVCSIKGRKNIISVVAETAAGNANTIHNQTINMSVKKGHPGYPVRCKELNRIWKTQSEAAQELGLNPAELSKHMNFKRDHVNGYTFERMIPEGTFSYLWY
jgi:hypothetical protein